MTMIWSALTAISLIRCEQTKTVRPSLASERKKSRIQRIPSGSRPLTGSSKKQHLGIAEQRARDAEALTHAQREVAHLLVGDRGDADELEDLVDARIGDAVRGGEGAQVVARGATGVDGLGVEQRADLVQGIAQFGVALALDECAALGRVVEPEDDAHRGRLARAVRAEKSGDDARAYLEVEVVDGDRVAGTAS